MRNNNYYLSSSNNGWNCQGSLELDASWPMHSWDLTQWYGQDSNKVRCCNVLLAPLHIY